MQKRTRFSEVHKGIGLPRSDQPGNEAVQLREGKWNEEDSFFPAHGARAGRNPVMAAGAGIIFPGTGQFYNGRTGRGLIIWSVLGAMILFAMVFPAFEVFSFSCCLGAWLYSVRDAYVTAQKINTGECAFEGPSPLVYSPPVLIVSAGMALLLASVFTVTIP